MTRFSCFTHHRPLFLLPLFLLFALLGFWAATPAGAQAEPEAAGVPTDEQLRELVLGLAQESGEAREETIHGMVRTGDPRMELVLEEFRTGRLYLRDGEVILGGNAVYDENYIEQIPISDLLSREAILDAAGQPVTVTRDKVVNIAADRNERRLISRVRPLLRLESRNPELRLAGVKKMGDSPEEGEILDRLEQIAAEDPVPKIRHTARESLALIKHYRSREAGDTAAELEAVAALGEIKSMRALPRLTAAYDTWREKREAGGEIPEGTLAIYDKTIATIGGHQQFVKTTGNIYQGLSLGSVLIFMALGLAITFGLMGVINMAHGELMMIGAYATYEMQLLFVRLIERGVISQAAYDYYYALALPASFLAAAFVGYIIEILVIRHLYRRPIESLLATWGIGLILIQLVRIHYGDNIGVNAPSWARGGVEVMQDVVLPYGRTYVIFLCCLCIAGIWLLMNRTRMGLLMRSTMQNRDMANALGVNTGKIDRFTFALGSGIAGIAGYAWTLIGGVTPDMGQKNFIVDSFLIVVTGGVGNLAGVVCSGLGIGITTKIIEPMSIGGSTLGAIWAKVIVLALIVTFIQFKPAGLFAPKGRAADA